MSFFDNLSLILLIMKMIKTQLCRGLLLCGLLVPCLGRAQAPVKTSDALPVNTELPAVETQPPVSAGQQPAFAGQTRIPGVKTGTPLQVSIIARNLRAPWGLAFLPDGRMLVTEKPGTMRIVTQQGTVGSTLLGVPAVRFQGDGGLYDVKLDPDFARSRLIFWTFVEPVAGGSLTSVARAKLSADETRLDDVRVIYQATPAYKGPNHNGSRMLFDPQGNLFVSFGDRFDDSIRVQAQELNSSLGKIVRITKEGKAAPGNPFANTPDARPEIWSLGHRNPQGLAIHPQTGDLWQSDIGPQAGDEINLIRPGANYGWPLASYGIEYSGKPVNEGKTTMEGTEQPVYYWDPTVAPSGMSFYTGKLIPEWTNNLFVPALRGMHIARLVIKDNKIVGEERLLADQQRRMRQVVQGPDGALYAITDDREDGVILRIAPQ